MWQLLSAAEIWDTFSRNITPVTNQLTTTVYAAFQVIYRHSPSIVKPSHVAYLLKSFECIHKNP